MAGFYRGAQNVATLVPGGYFAFMEYAIPQWLRNLEHGIAVVGQGRELMYELQESLEVFLNLHFKALTKQFAVIQGNMKRLNLSRDCSFYDNLEVAAISTRKELTFFGKMKENETALDLADIVKNHGVCVDEELDLPDLDEKNKQKEPRPEPLGVPRKPAEPNPELPKPKRPRIAESPCTSCPKVFNKKYNLISHQAAQTDRRDYRCTICFAAFARDHDRRRHEKTHEHKKFTCGGTLGSGQPWGCQKEFARADTLRNHCSTASGQDCIRPWLDDQGQPGHEVNSGPIVE
ncbi:C2H2 type zinc finger domain-containing protein [Seiridium cupressi]